jgi:hypothetical protein|uniref:ribosomal protein S3 n=1 Tax=Ancyromonas sigmoides TaxID=85707 RepID=UPI0028D241FD|nr:ribosomal protein S3 [Ancyromonas sigmoides]WMQ52558.1 ribosomal protein S3 [Ancyromonas sigmoides]
MAQKTNPCTLRSEISKSKIFSYTPRKQNLGRENLVALSIKNSLTKFYKNYNFDLKSIRLERDFQNMIVHVILQNTLKTDSEDKTSEEKSLSTVELPILTAEEKSSKIFEPIAYYVKCSNTDNFFLWSSETHTLLKSIFKEWGVYLYVIKSTLFCSLLNPIEQMNASNLSQHIQSQIALSDARRQKIHIKSYIDRIVDQVSSLENIQGLKIQLKGRLPSGGSGNKAGRSKKETSSYGNIPLQTITSHVDYSYNSIPTKSGTCGVKVWIHYN